MCVFAIFSSFASESASSSEKKRVFSRTTTSPGRIASIASIAGRPNRLDTYRTGRPRRAPMRSAWTSSVVKSSFPGRDWCARRATFDCRSSRIVVRCSRILASFRRAPVPGSIGELMSTRSKTVRPERSKSSIVKKSRAIDGGATSRAVIVFLHRDARWPPHAISLCSQTGKLGWNLFRGAGRMGRYHRGNLTPQDLLLPEGKLIRTTRGGPNALKQLLLDLKKYSFSGYVRSVRTASGRRAGGIVLLRGGNLETSLQADTAVLTASVVAMREGVKKAEAVAEILAGLDITGFESRAASLRERLRDPLGHPDIDTEVESLRDAIESLRQIEARRQVEVARERDSQERTRQVLELVMRQQQALRPGATLSTREEFAKALEEAPPARDEATNLVQSFTFESLVVGESNRFAHGAAIAVAKQPAKSYNPLLVTSGPGLGKTHLLHAIGNYIASHSRDSKVLYMTCEAFGSGLAVAKEQGSLASYRERIRGVDCFLLDDIQFLSGMPEVHEELFYTFNDLHDAEKQIVLATDRPPKAIPNLDERLVSRFESGLVAGLEPPELPMRIAILERRARDAKVSIDSDVLAYIANLVQDNVRELGGAFNRVVAFSSMMGRPINEEVAREVLSGARADGRSETVPEPTTEPRVERERTPSSGSSELTPGRSYLIEEERPG